MKNSKTIEDYYDRLKVVNQMRVVSHFLLKKHGELRIFWS